MGAFVISKRFSGDYKFEFTSRKGKTILTSNSFELRFECENQIEALKGALESCTFLKFKSSRGKFYFRMILNEKEIAISRKYSTQLMLQKGIDELLKYAPQSETLDFSTSDFIFPDAEIFDIEK